MNDIPLHDIKPLVEVPDNSFIFLLVTSLIVLLVVIGLVVWIVNFYKQKKQVNLRKIHLDKIHNIDISHAKEAAYEISHYGRLLANNDREL